MTYLSIKQIKDEFQLESNDLDILRNCLNQLRVDTHPDKSNGDFLSDIEKENYHKINDAINYIDSLKNNNQLMAIEKMTDLVKVVTDLIPNNKETSLQNNIDNKINSAIKNHKSKFFIPKISMTAIAGVMTFLFAIPTQIKDNPFFSKLLNPQSSTFIIIWLSILFYTGIFWILCYLNEEKAKRKLSHLNVDSTQNGLFEYFIINLNSDGFTKDEFTEFIFTENLRESGTNSLFGSNIFNMEIAQGISELILSKAEKKNIIQKCDGNMLSDMYLIKNYA